MMNDRQIAICVISILLFFSLSLVCSAADADESAAKSSNFKVSAGVLDGFTINGENYFMTDIIVENPTGEPMFKILPDKVWYRFIKSPKYQINQARFNYPFGESDTFAGAGWVDDHETGIGVRYTPNHWDVKGLENIDITAFIIEGGKYQFNVDVNYEFNPGYGIEAHAIYRTDSDLTRTLGDWEISAWHNWKPNGSMKGYASWVNNNDEELILFGMKVQTR